MKAITLVIIGPHSSGKTSIGKLVADHYQWIFHEEIGKQLRYKKLKENPNANAIKSQQDFDDEVIKKELIRDLKWKKYNRCNNRIVETWHMGNIAYAEQRKSKITKNHLLNINDNVKEAIVLPLRINKSTMLSRMREYIHSSGDSDYQKEYLADFLLTVANRTELIAKSMGLNILPPISTNNKSLELVKKEVLNLIKQHINI